ncbi:MAG: hypothetical protein CVV16_04925 [Gammaproteobacteria bacterium HGW-Gammaproteobacteria-6]|nr:MAG: hypothetical protein CVV16_04925 [Gammaproteobacteria bacterium HGW-Gammaproteobacteria-6]
MYQGILILAAVGLLVLGALELYQTGQALPAIGAGAGASLALAYAVAPRIRGLADASWAWRNPLSTALYLVGGLLAVGGAIMVFLNGHS